jgi:hypothetical protein
MVVSPAGGLSWGAAWGVGNPPTRGASPRWRRDSRQATHAVPGANPRRRMELSSLIGSGGTSKMKGMTSKKFGGTSRNLLEAAEAAKLVVLYTQYANLVGRLDTDETEAHF